MINNVVLIGRLTKDPELKYTSSGTAVASFTLAVSRDFKNQKGERETDFINCVAWRKTAEIAGQYTKKGTLVSVTGRIQTRSYENQQGQRVYVTEVVIDHLNNLESKKQQDNQGMTNQASQSNPNYNQQAPQGQYPQQQQNNQYNQPPAPQNNSFPSATGQGPFGTIDITDDDLPF